LLYHSTHLKTRIQQDTFTIYAETAADLDAALSSGSDIASNVKGIDCPESDAIALKLKENVIYQKDPTFKFRFEIAEGMYDIDIKRKLYAYLQNFGTDVHVPTQLTYLLQSSTGQYVLGFFYANDETII